MKLRQAQYQYIVVIYVANPMKIGGANIDYNGRVFALVLMAQILYGDGINMTGCRSFWNDEYGRRFGCKQLLEGGRDIVMDEIKREYPELFKN